ncbi:hypothetical protein TNCV_4235001 [Trichonephila clavipes]|nr:hypothetical protein TNCV_4235001 [Trichonephila clavipes]
MNVLGAQGKNGESPEGPSENLVRKLLPGMAAPNAEVGATEDPPYRELMHAKSAGVQLHVGVEALSVIFVTGTWLKITRSVANSLGVASKCDANQKQTNSLALI